MRESYRVKLTRPAEKDLAALKHLESTALTELLSLEENHELGHLLSGSLKGARALEFNLKGSGAYRAIYAVDPDLLECVVFILGPHENIYKKAERRWASLKKQIK